MTRFVLKRRHDVSEAAILEVDALEAVLEVVDRIGSRAMLVETEKSVEELDAALPGWVVAPETVLPGPEDDREFVRRH